MRKKINIEGLISKASAKTRPDEFKKQVCNAVLLLSWEKIFRLFVDIPCKTLY